MKMLMTISQDEMDLITELTRYGWLAIPKEVSLVVSDGGATVMVHPSAPPAVIPTPIPVPTPVEKVTLPPGTPEPGSKGGFDVVFKWLIPEEGGYTNDPDDPGGPTNFGIDTKDDSVAWKALGVTDIKDLTLEQAKGIYLSEYWNAALCDTMPTPIAETHFNYAVNVGREQSVKFMQAALGVVSDGEFGPITQKALQMVVANSPASVRATALIMVDEADKFYKSLAGQDRFAKDLSGWLRRNQDLRALIAKIS